MRRQLKRMEHGSEPRAKGKAAQDTEVAADDGNRGADFAVSLGSIPATGIDLARLVRDAKIQETIYTLLTQQLEQVKIAEARDTPTVRVLDRAVPPEWKSRPSVPKYTATAGLLSLLLGLSLAFVLEGRNRDKRWNAEGERESGQVSVRAER